MATTGRSQTTFWLLLVFAFLLCHSTRSRHPSILAFFSAVISARETQLNLPGPHERTVITMGFGRALFFLTLATAEIYVVLNYGEYGWIPSRITPSSGTYR